MHEITFIHTIKIKTAPAIAAIIAHQAVEQGLAFSVRHRLHGEVTITADSDDRTSFESIVARAEQIHFEQEAARVRIPKVEQP